MCSNCGNEFSNWSGRCSICGEWNTLKEVNFSVESASASPNKGSVESVSLSNVKLSSQNRFKTQIEEFDRVLGGGIVPGSIILLGGEPGIGKSTLLLQISNLIKNVLYVSAEESSTQIKLRADRLGIISESIILYPDGSIEGIEKEIAKNNPDIIIVDSIQTVFLNSIPSTPGSMVQVRECGIFFQKLAKKSGIPIILVGHVTKDGFLAGPRILEHLVDVVLYLEGDRFHDLRILRGIKNRFGATNESGIFTIAEEGMVEVKNPSLLFLSERQNEPGSVITSTLEGQRPILLEIQSLVSVTRFGYPKRTASGFDLNRLNLLAAVISKKTSINLNNYDIYVNVVGGFKVKDPAVDLAVCLAVISSYKNKKISNDICAFGEVGLSGEIRKVQRQEERAKEAKKLGYKAITAKDLSSLIKVLNI